METDKFDAVVLSGGGPKGILTLGTLHCLYERGIYDQDFVKEYAGTSIGSVICLLLICGYSPMEIFTEVYSIKDIFSFNDFLNIKNIMEHMGVLSIDGFITKISYLVTNKLGCVPSLGELKKNTGKIFHLASTNLSKMEESKYSTETTPNINCIEAIKYSCNIPLIFKKICHKGDYMVDGGLTNNFPWDYISDERENILGIVVKGKDSLLPPDNMMGYFYRLITFPISRITELRCDLAPKKVKIFSTSWKGGSLIQFSMNSNTKMEMFLAGYEAGEIKANVEYLTFKKPNIFDGWD